MRKLLLCCGPTRPSGYIRLDSNPEHEPDILAALPPLPEAARGPWDEIALIHGIEHVLFWEVKALVSQVHAALCPGGIFVLEQPNIEAAARVLLGLEPAPYGGVLESAMWPLYGDPAHKDEGYLHRWGWTPATLSAFLRESAPWHRIEVKSQQFHTYAMGRDFRVEAQK